MTTSLRGAELDPHRGEPSTIRGDHVLRIYRLRVGPLLLCTVVAVYRAVWLSTQLSGFHLSEVPYLILADVPVVGVLGIFAWLERVVSQAWRRVLLTASILLLAAYVADVFAVFALNARLQLEDVRRFAVEWWLFPSFLSLWSLGALAVVIASMAMTVSVSRAVFFSTPLVAGCLLVVPLTVRADGVPIHLQRYSASVLRLTRELWGGLQRDLTPRYSLGDLVAYREGYDALFEAPIARSRKDIILVIVESLSAVDSRRTSGLEDRLPRFDELSREGMLFRNFFANFEASEGGIIALLSGVPPLHFPTASTDVFREYASQRAIAGAFAREGYRSEFLTNVPLQFISMDHYAKSPIVGFSFAAGQREIARYQGAPRFAFESPADHLLYEEILSRLDQGDRQQQPAFLVAITASSHSPFVDPLGRGDTAEHAWAYVQDELWWLFNELKRRRYFDNGFLVITGDHRRMLPVHASERERYGDSAKARIPLVVIGSAVPRDAVDDRMFQQADLLRMLDKAIRPGVPLSPFALWVERYMFVFGLASKASNLEVFEAHDHGRRGTRLNLRGPHISWEGPPADRSAIERSIHRQRASQQARRAATALEAGILFGRDLSASNGSHGVLVGVSMDANLTRDPDDAAGSLKLWRAESLDLRDVLERAGAHDSAFTLTARAFLDVPQEGEYWFSAFSNNESCLAIDKKIVLNCGRGLKQGLALLTAGVHRFDFRLVHRSGTPTLDLRWLPPGAQAFVDFPEDALVAPAH